MFKNEPLTDFTEAENRTAMSQALNSLEQRIKKGELLAKPIIRGESIATKEEVNCYDPSSLAERIGRVQYADSGLTAEALRVLKGAQAQFRSMAPIERANRSHKLARLIQARKFELASLIIREAGKSWREADADVAETIDFCNYYADQALRLGTAVKTMDIPGEDNFYFYQPRGLAVVIAPWNFPLAIACGMTIAALVTGNCTILKPAEQTSLIAYQLALLILEAGFPADAFAFLPGRGEEIGRMMVNSPDVDLVCFTGSKAVGLEIIKSCATVVPGQSNVKKVIAEMGGKNAIIIDQDADLDEAIKGVIASAFGFGGQKCSACSRLIVVGDAYEPMLTRLKDATADVITGKASDPATFFGPVIDAESKSRIEATISAAEGSHKLLFKGTPASAGHYVPAVIFRDVDPTSSLWREEIFGPVLSCTKARTFDQALELANDSQYALTGGVFSRSPENIEKAKREFLVGNLYINRSCTGALVCRQPFGGFKMSGVGSKAGGPDYLIQFLEPRTVSENTLRRGFAPNQA